MGIYIMKFYSRNCYSKVIFFVSHFSFLLAWILDYPSDNKQMTTWLLMLHKITPEYSFNLMICILAYYFLLFIFLIIVLGLKKHWAVVVRVREISLVHQRGCNKNLRLSLSGRKLYLVSFGITNLQMKRYHFLNKINRLRWSLVIGCIRHCLGEDFLIVLVPDFYLFFLLLIINR
jgi:hypothetical protein